MFSKSLTGWGRFRFRRTVKTSPRHRREFSSLVGAEPLEARRLLAVIGARDLLYVRVQFSDQSVAPETLETSTQMTRDATAYLQKWSGSQLSLTVTIKDVILTQPTTSYTSSSYSAIARDALAALQAEGLDTTPFEHRCFRYNGLGGGGYANHSNTAWVKQSSTRILAHELGHTLGLYHSNFWNPTDNSDPFGPGETVSYGDIFSIMGSASSRDWNAHQKWFLGHIRGSQVQAIDVQQLGTTTITLSNHENRPALTTDDVYLVRIPYGTSALYAEYRTGASGVLLHRASATRPNGGVLLDGNPQTETASDAALRAGQTFVAEFGTAENDEIQVKVNSLADGKAVLEVTVGSTPQIPAELNGTPSDGQASLSWSAPDSVGGSPITDYVVQFSSNDGSTWTTFDDGISVSTTATVSGLSNGTGYVFRVAARNSAGTGAFSSASATVTPRTTPAAPASVTGTPANSQVALSWTAPSSTGGSTITDYTVQYSSNSGSTWTTFNDGTATTTSATVTGLTNGFTYTFRVAARNAAGVGAYSAQSAAVVPCTVPGRPTDLTGTVSGGDLSLSWTAPASDGGSVITDYVVQYNAHDGSGWTTWRTFVDGVSPLTAATVTGLANGTRYVFRVAAKNIAGTGLYAANSPELIPRTVAGVATLSMGTGGQLLVDGQPVTYAGSPVTASFQSWTIFEAAVILGQNLFFAQHSTGVIHRLYANADWSLVGGLYGVGSAYSIYLPRSARGPNVPFIPEPEPLPADLLIPLEISGTQLRIDPVGQMYANETMLTRQGSSAGVKLTELAGYSPIAVMRENTDTTWRSTLLWLHRVDQSLIEWQFNSGWGYSGNSRVPGESTAALELAYQVDINRDGHVGLFS